jgi:hypothetical protein
MKNSILTLMIGIFCILTLFANFVNATTTCNPTSITQSVLQGETANSQTITCTHSGNDSVIVSKTGDFFSTVPAVNFVMNPSESILISFQTKPVGYYTGSITFSDGTTSIPITLNVSNPPQTQYDVIVFPTSKIVSIQQGQTKNINIQVIVPSTYPRKITIQSVNFNPDIDVAVFEDLNLGELNPGQTLNIPVKINAVNAQVGIYNTQIIVLATDSNGQVPLSASNLQINVQTGINPTSNDTFNSKPSCSLSVADMSLNGTYVFTCTGVISNILVNPIYSEYIEGIRSETSSGVYTYTFKPIKIGNTQFKAMFTYQGSPIFSAFTKDIRISYTGATNTGSRLKFLFDPEIKNAKNEELVIIQLVDNLTGSLVDNPEVYIDGLLLTNQSGNSYFYAFKTDRTYSIRGRSPAYNDITETINLTQIPINVYITPVSGDAETIFNISTSPNATLKIDNVVVSNPYQGSIQAGVHEIKAIKDGYTDNVQNITIDQSIIVSSFAEFKKGVLQTLFLNKNATWELQYQEDVTKVPSTLLSGTSDKIEFTPKDKGSYYLMTDGKQRWSQSINGWDGKIWKFMWYWYLSIIVVIVLLFLIFKNKHSSDDISVPIH